jgi:hypothetical protein
MDHKSDFGHTTGLVRSPSLWGSHAYCDLTAPNSLLEHAMLHKDGASPFAWILGLVAKIQVIEPWQPIHDVLEAWPFKAFLNKIYVSSLVPRSNRWGHKLLMEGKDPHED